MASDGQNIFVQQKEAVNILLTNGKNAYTDFLEECNMIDFLNEEEKEYITELNLEEIIYSEDEPCLEYETNEITHSDPEVCSSLECDGPHLILQSNTASASQTKMVFSPGIRNEIIKMIKNSTSSIKIAVFMFTEASIFNAICEKKLSSPSIAVHIQVDESQYKEFLDMAKKSISKKFSNQLIGINVKSINKHGNTTGQRSGKAHEKFMIIDGSLAATGSFNFTWASEHINYEQIVISQDKDNIVTPLLKRFRNLAKRNAYEVL